MRTWGRVWGAVSDAGALPIVSSSGNAVIPSGYTGGAQPAKGTPTSAWVEVSTDANGNNDLVYLTTLCQCLLLNLNESPFYANYGIPYLQAVQQQVPPDVYVMRMQKAFAQYFASLVITRTASNPPTYQVNVRTHQGVALNANVPIPY